MTPEASPFEEGDRIDHTIFGFGTVDALPTLMMGPYMSSRTGGVRDAGWRVPVRWDDPAATARAVMHYALRKVAAPDSRPFAYWDRRWQPLLQAWLTSRREVKRTVSSFRPAPASADIASLHQSEQKAFEAMRRFWDDERAGKHL